MKISSSLSLVSLCLATFCVPAEAGLFEKAKSFNPFGGGDKKTESKPVPAERSDGSPAAPGAEPLSLRPAPGYLTVEPDLPVAGAENLDVGVNLFGYAPRTVILPQDEAKVRAAEARGERVFLVDKAPEAIREVESYALAVMLRDELEASSAFRSVSLRPGETAVHDLVIDGEIRKSVGNHAVLRLTATGADGLKWFAYDYAVEPSQAEYEETPPDPYGEAFRRFAYSLLNKLERQDEKKLERLQRFADVAYAASLAPKVFGDYVETDSYGRTRLVGAPNPDDPFWKFAMKCRDEENRIIGSDFGEFYTDSHAAVYPTYLAWRREYGGSLEQYDLLLEEREQAVKAARNQYLKEQLVKLAPAIALGRTSKSDILEDFLKTEAYLLLTGSIQVGDDGEFYFNVDEGMGNRYPEVQKRYDAARDKERAASQQHDYMAEQSEAFEAHAEPINVNLFDATVALEGSVEKQFAAFRAKVTEVYERETGGILREKTASLR